MIAGDSHGGALGLEANSIAMLSVSSSALAPITVVLPKLKELAT